MESDLIQYFRQTLVTCNEMMHNVALQAPERRRRLIGLLVPLVREIVQTLEDTQQQVLHLRSRFVESPRPVCTHSIRAEADNIETNLRHLNADYRGRAERLLQMFRSHDMAASE